MTSKIRFPALMDCLLAGPMHELYGSSFSPKTGFSLALASIPAAHRFYVNAINHLLCKVRALEAKGTCLACWVSPCICDRFTPYLISSSFSSSSTSDDETNPRVVLFMHYKEWGRSSNSGKVVAALMPTPQSAICLYGLPQHESYLQALCAAPQTFVLFPAQNATPAAEATRGLAFEAATVVLVDCTWSQAHAMREVLPSGARCITLGRESAKEEVLFAALRKRTRSDGMSTLEAYVQLLREAAWTQGGKDGKLEDGLKALIQAAEESGRAMKKRKLMEAETITAVDP
jgi:DTW domain-containing protein YfiP